MPAPAAAPAVAHVDVPDFDDEVQSSAKPAVMRKSKSKMPRLMGRPKVKEENPFVHSHAFAVANAEPGRVAVRLDTSGQHTLSWDVKLKASDGSGTLPAGSLNLYLFPAMATSDGELYVPEGGALALLQAVLVAIGTDPSSSLFDQPDLVGAMPIHALAVRPRTSTED